MGMDDLVVPRNALADAGENVRIVDVREAWEYDGIGHIPGAVSIPFDEFRTAGSGPKGMLPDPEHWASLLGSRGIGPGSTLVAYDDTHGVFAARFVVTALLYGHDDVHLLDGDYSAWIRDFGVSTDSPAPTPREYPIPELNPAFLVDADAVASAARSPDTILVDTRSPEEFAEGHIEGAVNLDWVELVDDESRGLRPVQELRHRLEERGLTPDRRVVLYCNTARRISHTYVVLRHLGFEDVRFYEGSLTEWRASDRPLVMG
jgi:thiosulfate/3-mercaptopyruvate sulfurtransferase